MLKYGIILLIGLYHFYMIIIYIYYHVSESLYLLISDNEKMFYQMYRV